MTEVVLKDCKWKVKVVDDNEELIGCYWIADAKNNHGLINGGALTGNNNFTTTQEAKNDWEKFAKINRFKHWSYE